jgi:hypothetical protein
VATTAVTVPKISLITLLSRINNIITASEWSHGDRDLSTNQREAINLVYRLTSLVCRDIDTTPSATLWGLLKFNITHNPSLATDDHLLLFFTQPELLSIGREHSRSTTRLASTS